MLRPFSITNDSMLSTMQNRLRKRCGIKPHPNLTVWPFGFTSGSSNHSDFGYRAITRRFSFILFCKQSLLSQPPSNDGGILLFKRKKGVVLRLPKYLFIFLLIIREDRNLKSTQHNTNVIPNLGRGDI
jgi:hypothetical protein